MFDDQLIDVHQFMTPKAPIAGDRYRLEPELGVAAGVRHVDVRRFAILETVEVERYPRTRNSAGTQRVYRAVATMARSTRRFH